jgi:hypothetical protein
MVSKYVTAATKKANQPNTLFKSLKFFMLFLAGFLAEMISRNASERNNYIIDQEL